MQEEYEQLSAGAVEEAEKSVKFMPEFDVAIGEADEGTQAFRHRLLEKVPANGKRAVDDVLQGWWSIKRQKMDSYISACLPEKPPKTHKEEHYFAALQD